MIEEEEHREYDEEERTDIVTTADLASVAPRDQAYLIVLAGSRVGEMVRIDRDLSVGRGGDADFRVTDKGVSRVHMRLQEGRDGRVRLADADSRNGTLVNGERVRERVLKEGDKIQIGSTAVFRFSFADHLDESFQQRMFDAAQRDALTGLFNRRYLLQQLESEFHYLKRHKTPLTVIVMDIDHFKRVNDEHGHVVGDAVLVGFARSLGGWIRGEDLLARYGGEEFVMACRETSRDTGLAVADRLRQRIAQATLVESTPLLRVTFSAGVATAPDPRLIDPKSIIEAADEALYQAKRGGRNRVILFS